MAKVPDQGLLFESYGSTDRIEVALRVFEWLGAVAPNVAILLSGSAVGAYVSLVVIPMFGVALILRLALKRPIWPALLPLAIATIPLILRAIETNQPGYTPPPGDTSDY